MYVSDANNNTIRKITPGGSVTTLAGLAGTTGSVDGSGSAARFNNPMGIGVDGEGNVFVVDRYNHTIRKITPSGIVTTFAGYPGQSGSSNGTGAAARFAFPTGLAVDSAGNVYVADGYNCTIRKITPNAVVTTLAGRVAQGGTADGQGSAARFGSPSGVAVDGAGNVYVADEYNQTIRRITPIGYVTTLAGNPTIPAGGYADGKGRAALFNLPVAVALDSATNVYVADYSNNAIRKVTPDGVVTTLAGDPTQLDQNGNPVSGYVDAGGSAARFNQPSAVAVDGSGRISVVEAGNNTIRRITAGGEVTTLTGMAWPSSGSEDGMGATARFNWPSDVAPDALGNVFVADYNNHTIRMVAPWGEVTTFAGLAGNPGSNDGTGSSARFNYPICLTSDPAGDLFVSDSNNHTIRMITPWGVVTTVAGQVGNPGRANGTGTAAQFYTPTGLALDSGGNLYVADRDNHTIRKVTPAGEVTTVAGLAGMPGSADGLGTAARFSYPRGVAVDSATNLYVGDTGNNTIRKITPGGSVTTLAGLAGTVGSTDGTRSRARFNFPTSVIVEGAGNVYVSDEHNCTLRKVTPGGVVTTLAGLAQPDVVYGNPLAGNADGEGSAARFNTPRGLALDSSGNLYWADAFNNTIRVGTTNSCPDKPTVDLASGPALQTRQLDTSPQTALVWHWTVVRRPANSLATLSDPNVRNPTFTPDVADLYIFQLRATNDTGALCIRTVSLTATPTPAPSIFLSSLVLSNAQFTFTIQSLAGNRVEIQTSQDLANWTSLATVTNLTGITSFTDQPVAPQPRFYRLRQF
jgi:sugar lactone lactonase YvrE